MLNVQASEPLRSAQRVLVLAGGVTVIEWQPYTFAFCLCVCVCVLGGDSVKELHA